MMKLENSEGTLRVNDVDLWYKVIGSGPVLMVQAPGWGVQPVRTQAQMLFEGIAGSRLVEFADSGHMCWLEEPQRFRSELDTFMRAISQ